MADLNKIQTHIIQAKLGAGAATSRLNEAFRSGDEYEMERAMIDETAWRAKERLARRMLEEGR